MWQLGSERIVGKQDVGRISTGKSPVSANFRIVHHPVEIGKRWATWQGNARNPSRFQAITIWTI
jgi:hypothetical protein